MKSWNTNSDVTMKTQTISDLFVTGIGEENLPKRGAGAPENIYIDASCEFQLGEHVEYSRDGIRFKRGIVTTLDPLKIKGLNNFLEKSYSHVRPVQNSGEDENNWRKRKRNDFILGAVPEFSAKKQHTPRERFFSDPIKPPAIKRSPNIPVPNASSENSDYDLPSWIEDGGGICMLFNKDDSEIAINDSTAIKNLFSDDTENHYPYHLDLGGGELPSDSVERDPDHTNGHGFDHARNEHDHSHNDDDQGGALMEDDAKIQHNLNEERKVLEDKVEALEDYDDIGPAMSPGIGRHRSSSLADFGSDELPTPGKRSVAGFLSEDAKRDPTLNKAAADRVFNKLQSDIKLRHKKDMVSMVDADMQALIDSEMSYLAHQASLYQQESIDDIDTIASKEEKPVDTSPPPNDTSKILVHPPIKLDKLVVLSTFEDFMMSRTLLVGDDILQSTINLAQNLSTRAEADLAVPESTANPFSAVPKQRSACMQNQSLYTLIYACDILEDNRKDFEATCKNIGSIAKKKNREMGITGMLMMYEVPDKPGVFGAIQRLEGSKRDVKNLYETITKDRRAKNFEVLTEKTISEKSFGEWYMGLWVGYPDEDELEDHRQALFYDRASDKYMNKVSKSL